MNASDAVRHARRCYLSRFLRGRRVLRGKLLLTVFGRATRVSAPSGRLFGPVAAPGGLTGLRVEVQPEHDPNAQRERRALLRYASMGVELAGAVIGLTLLGLWIDYRFATGIKATIIGAAVGIVGGMYNFIRRALDLTKTQLPPTGNEKDDEHHDTTGSQS